MNQGNKNYFVHKQNNVGIEHKGIVWNDQNTCGV